jgi:hypothetical protein
LQLIFACPTYGPTEPAANIATRIAIMHAAANGNTWIGDASPNRQGWEAARNGIVDSVVNSDAPDDASIFWCDSDVILPADAITRLAVQKKDFISGIYFQRRKPHFPLIATFNGKVFHWVMKWPENTIAPIDGCGFGCVLTSVGMLRKLGAPWFKFETFSEDFDFCLKAQKEGYQLYVDTGVICGHLQEPEPATFDDFKKLHPEFYSEANDGTELTGIGSERPEGDLVIHGS